MKTAKLLFNGVVKVRMLTLLCSLFLFFFTVVAQAAAIIDVRIDLSKQEMEVIVAGDHEYTWKISSARRGYETPTGWFRPNWMTRMHYSEQYDNSPMPHSIFFHEGYAIHGTNETKRLGRQTSHGCVRLSKRNARTLYNLVRKYGMAETRILVRNRLPKRPAPFTGEFPTMMDEHDL